MSFTSLRRRAVMTAATATLAAALPFSLITATTTANATPTRAAVTATHSVAARTAAATTTDRSPQGIARSLVNKRYRAKSKQWKCLNALWNRESGWRVHAGSPGGAYGIPQAFPGRKMGAGWRHSARTQITWGLRYIDARYGSPCGADRHQRSHGWY